MKFVLCFFLFYQRNKDGKTAIDLLSETTKSKLPSLEKIACLKPSNNELPIAPPARRRGRTLSATNVLFLTGFEKGRKESLVKSVQTIFGRKCVTSAKHVENNGSNQMNDLFISMESSFLFFSVTHVIACGEEDKIAFRTINYLRGIVLGKWIISEKCRDFDEIISKSINIFSYSLGIDECIRQKQWINENAFEILGSQLEPNSNGSHLSRIKHEQNVKTRTKTISFDFNH